MSWRGIGRFGGLNNQLRTTLSLGHRIANGQAIAHPRPDAQRRYRKATCRLCINSHVYIPPRRVDTRYQGHRFGDISPEQRICFGSKAPYHPPSATLSACVYRSPFIHCCTSAGIGHWLACRVCTSRSISARASAQRCWAISQAAIRCRTFTKKASGVPSVRARACRPLPVPGPPVRPVGSTPRNQLLTAGKGQKNRHRFSAGRAGSAAGRGSRADNPSRGGGRSGRSGAPARVQPVRRAGHALQQLFSHRLNQALYQGPHVVFPPGHR